MGTDKYSGEAGSGAEDKKIEESFRAVEKSASLAMDRVRAAVASGAVPAARRHFWKTAAAGALCFAAALLVILLRRPGPAAPGLSPDWRSDYNFPSYSGQAEPAVAEEAPDWRSAYQFPEYRGGRDTSGM